MTVVVTGSSGFIGSQLVAALAERGERVVGIDHNPDGRAATIAADLANPSLAALEALGAAEVVWHLAGRPGVRDRRREIKALRHHDNVVATERVLQAVPAGTLVVVASSSSVYGGSIHRGSERACREDDPLRPRGGYAVSKHAAEVLCARRASRGGRVAIARPFTVAGEHQRPDMAIATWITSIAAGEPITVFGSPIRTRDISDVSDVVRGFLAIAGVVRPGSSIWEAASATPSRPWSRL